MPGLRGDGCVVGREVKNTFIHVDDGELVSRPKSQQIARNCEKKQRGPFEAERASKHRGVLDEEWWDPTRPLRRSTSCPGRLEARSTSWRAPRRAKKLLGLSRCCAQRCKALVLLTILLLGSRARRPEGMFRGLGMDVAIQHPTAPEVLDLKPSVWDDSTDVEALPALGPQPLEPAQHVYVWQEAASKDSTPNEEASNMERNLLLHQLGTCRPCSYYYFKEDGCRNGDDCEFCHFCSPAAVKESKRRFKRDARREKRAAHLEAAREAAQEQGSEPPVGPPYLRRMRGSRGRTASKSAQQP
ncbi:unnamed protein product [Symbiodinium natans]|uniref:C3H1-type domain-containing protein n=1 Tax=Symbiodinium natans TaxID=878477 RepID=A0A812ICD8_9DINO|nr:unnamed protein product [Symbiodinium natans]